MTTILFDTQTPLLRAAFSNTAMKIYHSLKEYRQRDKGVCVALGFFDGVHPGHRAVIGECAADSDGRPCTVLTFRESPAKTLGKPAPPLLSTNSRKARLMEQAGADEVIFADFKDIMKLSPEDFVKTILRDRLNAVKVFCGFNYRFGQGGGGDTDALCRLCSREGIAVKVISAVMCGGEQVSSSRIRELIAAGDIARANEMLGYRFAIEGRIDSGNHIGSAMGFPTVNLPTEPGIVTPRYGVYASSILIDSVRYRGATNIGVHPTVGENSVPLCETFLLDFPGGDLYGKNAVCELLSFVREEKRFDSMEALSAQIKQDCEKILSM